MDKCRILYFQHAGSLGGSIYSLAYLIEALDKEKYDPTVVLLNNDEKIISLYKRMGVATIIEEGIYTFGHTTGGWASLKNPLSWPAFAKSIFFFIPSINKTKRVIEENKPDIVHLNSLVLSPSAIGVKIADVPFVWHIRESVADGYLGLRKKLLGSLVIRLPEEAIFISSDNKKRLVDDRKGIVIPNFVDLEQFSKEIEPASPRKDFGLREDDKIILFLGGLGVIKGIFPLLNSLTTVKRKVPRMKCLIAGGSVSPSRRLSSTLARRILPLIGSGTVAQKVDRLMKMNNMYGYVHMLPWEEDVRRLIALCDVLVFPSIEPHFARPVIEAGAMEKPVVASCIGGVEELVEDGVTGYLVPPNDEVALAEALIKVLKDKALASAMGARGLERACKKYSEKNIADIEKIYERLITEREINNKRPL